MTKVLVTGAGGYLGVGIVNELLKIGVEVIATGHDLSKVNNNATLIEANIFEIANPYEYFEKPDILLHLAWRDGFIHNSKAHFEDLSKHITFLEKMFNSNLKKITVMGSMHEVGFFEGSIDEYTQTQPMNYYGIAKDSLRNFVNYMSVQSNTDYQWLRAFYIVGDSDAGSSIFSKIIKAENEGKEFFPFTTGINQYDFLDYDDFCYRTVITIVQNEILGVINICSGKPQKLSDRVEKFIEDNKLKISLQYGAFPDRKYDSLAVWGNSRKIDEIILKRE